MSDYKPLLTHCSPLVQMLERVTCNAVAAVPTPYRALKRADECPANLLPWLAWERGIDVWRDDWSDDYKREMISNIGAIKRKKGTHWAITALFASVNIIVDLVRDRDVHAPHAFSIRIPVAKNARVIADKANTKLINEIKDLAESVVSARDTFDLSMTDEVLAAPAVNRVLHTLAHSDAGVIQSTVASPSPHLFFFRFFLPKSRGSECLLINC